jgi:hypothetical protein
MPGRTRINPQSHDLTIGSIDRYKKIIRFTKLPAKFHKDNKKRQGAISQAAEKPNRSHHKRQGTTSVVPQVQQEDVGL